jgi:hypothetical protein
VALVHGQEHVQEDGAEGERDEKAQNIMPKTCHYDLNIITIATSTAFSGEGV